MAKIKVYNLSGKEVSEKEVDDKIFAVKTKKEVIHLAAVAQRANSRIAIANTKTKGEVRGGGKKPWKQKGTGQARAGSNRSPLWRGGGIIFGPRSNRNFSIKINKKAKNLAMRMMLSDKVAENKLILLEKLEVTDGKTKSFKKIISALPCKNHLSLVSLAGKNEQVLNAARNMNKTAICAANSLNVIDLLKYEYLVSDLDGLNKIVEVYKVKNKE